MSDESYLNRVNADEHADLDRWLRSAGPGVEAPKPGEQPKGPTPEEQRGFWSDFLGSTAADVASTLTKGLTWNIIQPHHLGSLGRLIERNKTPEDRKTALRQWAEWVGIELPVSFLSPLTKAVGVIGKAAEALVPAAGVFVRGAVRGAAEATAVGAASQVAPLARGEETVGEAAARTGIAGILGAGVGAAAGKLAERIGRKGAGEPAAEPTLSRETPPSVTGVLTGQSEGKHTVEAFFTHQPTLEQAQAIFSGEELPNIMITKTDKGWSARVAFSSEADAAAARAKIEATGAPRIEPPAPPVQEPEAPPPPPFVRSRNLSEMGEQEARRFIKENPSAIRAGDSVITVDWDRVPGNAEYIEDALRKTVSLYRKEGTIGAPPDAPLSDKQVNEMLLRRGYTVTESLAREPMEGLNRIEMRGNLEVVESAWQHTKQIMDQADLGHPDAIEAFVSQLYKTIAVGLSALGAKAESGASLRESAIAAEVTRQATLKRLVDLAQYFDTAGTDVRLQGGVTPQRLLAMVHSITDDIAKSEQAGKVTTFGQWARHGLVYAWLQTRLGNPAVFGKKFAGDLFALTLDPLERGHGRLFSPGAHPGIAPGEVSAKLYGDVRGAIAAFKLTGDAIKQNARTMAIRSAIGFGSGFGLSAAGQGDTEQNIKWGVRGAMLGAASGIGPLGHISGEAVDHGVRRGMELPPGVAPESWTGRTLDGLMGFIGYPGSIIGTLTDFMKIVNFHGELHAQAVRRATNILGATGDALAGAIDNLAQNPTEAMIRSAVRTAQERTFTDPMGPTGEAALNLLNKIDEGARIPVSRYILPFRQVPMKLGAFFFERSPLALAFSRKYREAVAGGGTEAQLAKAKVAVGSELLAIGAVLAGAGYITGSGPADPTMKRTQREIKGWLPNAVKVGEKYYSIEGLHPSAQWLTVPANVHEMVANLPPDDALMDDVGWYAVAAGAAMAKSLLDPTWMRGPTDILEVLTSGDDRKVQRMWNRMVGGVVPTELSAVRRDVDPIWLEVRSWGDAIRAQVPGLSLTVKPHLNLFGDPIFYQGAFPIDQFSPVYTSRDVNDLVANELADNKMRIPPVPRVIGGAAERGMFRDQPPNPGVMLTDEQWYRFKLLAGKGVRIDGMNLHEYLADMMKTDEYRRESSGQGGGRELLVLRTIHEFRQEALEKLYAENPGLEEAVERAQVGREERLETGSAAGRAPVNLQRQQMLQTLR